jgi:hypothetical protein
MMRRSNTSLCAAFFQAEEARGASRFEFGWPACQCLALLFEGAVANVGGLIWCDLQRDEVTRSCGGLRGLSARFLHASISISRSAPLAIKRARRLSHARMESFATPHGKKTVRLFMNDLIGLQDRSVHFATAVAFSLFETLLELAQALLQASMGQQDLDNWSKLEWTVAPDCN